VLVSVFVAAAYACATAPSDGDGPIVDDVYPEQGPAGEEQEITITGRDMEPALYTNAACGGQSVVVDEEFDAILADSSPYQFELIRVTWVSSGEITAVVPNTVPAGTYDLTLIDPRGRVVTYEAAYTIDIGDGSGSDADTDYDSDEYDYYCPAPEECVETCNDPCSMLCDTIEFCKLNCNGGGCDFVCDGTGDCDLDCHQEGGCTATHTGTGLFEVKCAAGDCQVSCPGPGGCLVDCAAETCEITDCPVAVETCGFVLACNTSC
jgi:hypothetical protein